MSSPKLVSPPPTSSPALCVEQMWVSLGAPSLAPAPSLPTPVRPEGVQGVLLTSPPCSSSHPVFPSFSSSLLYLLPLYLVCVFKTARKLLQLPGL